MRSLYALIPLEMLIAVLRKSKIQHTESARPATTSRKISWLAPINEGPAR